MSIQIFRTFSRFSIYLSCRFLEKESCPQHLMNGPTDCLGQDQSPPVHIHAPSSCLFSLLSHVAICCIQGFSSFMKIHDLSVPISPMKRFVCPHHIQRFVCAHFICPYLSPSHSIQRFVSSHPIPFNDLSAPFLPVPI